MVDGVYMGEVRLFSLNFAPKGWAFCNGQQMPIRQYTALYSLLGMKYGGDGRTFFKLPDIRGRAFVGAGREFIIAETGGRETVQLSEDQLPPHNHPWRTSRNANSLGPPANRYLTQPSANGTNAFLYIPGGSETPTIALDAIEPAGKSTPYDNMQPFLVLNYCIALSGVFPSPA